MDGATSKWKFRPPPRGLVKENLRMCRLNEAEDCCQLGDLCDEAHSQQELQEWRTRWEEDHRSVTCQYSIHCRIHCRLHFYNKDNLGQS